MIKYDETSALALPSKQEMKFQYRIIESLTYYLCKNLYGVSPTIKNVVEPRFSPRNHASGHESQILKQFRNPLPSGQF